MSNAELKVQSIVTIYNEVMSGERSMMLTGTWEQEYNIIIILRYVLEVKLKLSKQEIPRINRQLINEHKLWGPLNRFKSIPKLIKFIYPNQYSDLDFSRVPAGYWADLENIRKRFELCLKQNNYTREDIPSVVTFQLLVKWGFSTPLKRWGHSPYKLINALYPGAFKEVDFRSVPQRYWNNHDTLKKQIKEMLAYENINLVDAPIKVTQKMLIDYRLGTALKSHDGSPSKLFLSLFPNQFQFHDFHKTNGYWKNIDNVKVTIEELVKNKKIDSRDIPAYITKTFLKENQLGGLLHQYNGSPIELVQKLYPSQYDVTEFQRVPNKYWHTKKHRTEALRRYCQKQKVTRDKIPSLTRAHFRKHLPRFISMVDRHYDSKFHLWIIESFPEFDFNPSEFNLLIGIDGQVCDSKEEVQIHNFLVNYLSDGGLIREGEKFRNERYKEIYYPDWVILQDSKNYIVEYFGLYESCKYKGYTEKANRKIDYFRGLEEYEFIPIMPKDFRNYGFEKIHSLLKDKGIRLQRH
jgi:hypothetical protein